MQIIKLVCDLDLINPCILTFQHEGSRKHNTTKKDGWQENDVKRSLMGKYWVTGSAGFIGSRVSALLLQMGHEVIGIDNLNDAYDVRLKEWRLKQITPHSNFKFFRQDISDQEGLQKIFDKTGKPAGVINLAARAGVPVSVKNPWIYMGTNATGTLNLLDLCVKNDISKFVLASTSSLYGLHNPLPFREDANTDWPISPYAASKKAAETMCYTYHHLYGLDVTVFRYFTVYGPAGRPDMSIFRFARWIIEGKQLQVTGDGTQSRDFTYVDDIARGTIAGIKPMGYEIINLGSDRPSSLNEMILLLEELIQKKAKISYFPTPHTDIKSTWANIDKAGELLGWSPQTSFLGGLTFMVEWMKENQALTLGISLPNLLF
jgi:nucleoside-diphosphate-sugar epimerase